MVATHQISNKKCLFMRFNKSIALFFILIISTSVFAQIGNENGRYNDVINECYKVLSDIRHQKKSALKKRFAETGFQEKEDFSEFVNGKNLRWAKDIILEYGIPKKEEISISEWRVASRETDGNSSSINLTFYFKEDETEFNPINDHISLNFKSQEGTYILDGMMFFKKDEYLKVKSIIDNMP